MISENRKEGRGMYTCNIHGKLKTEWCDECGKIVSCDCSESDTARFKDLIFDCAEGERTVSVYIDYCNQCGKLFDVRF